MADGYDPQAIEERWQRRWQDEGTYEVDNDDPRPHFYSLCMYPYPSGPAHMGHVRNYSYGDLIVRHRTMNGYAVLSPMGFDSFGLPAENAAISTVPWTVGRSLFWIASNASRPSPGMLKTASMRIAPPSSRPRSIPRIVTIGVIAARTPWW